MKPSKTKPSDRRVKIALIQMSCGEDPHENFNKALALIEGAANQGAHIVATQELFRTRYFCQIENRDYFQLAEPIPGKSKYPLAKLAEDRRIVIVASLFEYRMAGVYHNTAVVIDADGQLLGKYRKMHIPDDPLYYEKFYFTPGDLGFNVFDTRFGRIGVQICWDQWYPEGARLTSLRGAEILFYPTAIGWHPSEKDKYGERQHSSWEIIQRSHAVANGIYVASINRTGYEPTPEGFTGEGLEFWGQSFIADPAGQIMAKASVTEDQILTAECDLNAIEFERNYWPFLRDRRIDAYHEITKRLID